MNLTLNVVSLGFILLSVIWLYRTAYSYFSLRIKRSQHPLKKQTPFQPTIHILLPVLNEDTRLKDFSTYFLKTLQPCYPDLKLTIVTTERESREYPRSTTIEIAKNIARRSHSISHVHYPHTQGVMAHQLNYAIKDIPNSDIVAIYNADSRPEVETFQWVLDRCFKESQQVFQQYGVYTKNINYLKNNSQFPSTLISNAYWQCRWSLGFEYYRAQSTFNKKRWPRILKPFNYCVGHGLFITSSLIKELQFSEDTTNEDAPLGIQIASKNLSPTPIPYFDISESPDTIRAIYAQKTNWMQGPLQAPLYFKKLYKTTATPISLLINCIKLFSHTLYWIAGPALLMLCLVLSIILAISTAPVYALYILSPLAFLVVPTVIAHLVITSLKVTDNEIHTSKLLLSLLFGSVPAYLLHGAAGIRGAIISREILNGKKQKTAMSQYGEV